jgi:uncharacterized protein YyaL (SSP411 family)
VIAIPAEAGDLHPALADKRPAASTVAYVCRGTTCSPPLATLGALVRSLKTSAD